MSDSKKPKSRKPISTSKKKPVKSTGKKAAPRNKQGSKSGNKATSKSSKKSSAKPARRNLKSTKKTRKNWKRYFLNRFTLYFVLIFTVLFGLYLVYLDHQISQKMSGRIWSLPSYIYARPMELYEDKRLSVTELQNELKSVGYHKTSNRPEKPGEYRILKGAHFEIISRDFTFWDGLQSSQGIALSIYNNKVSGLHDLYTNNPLSLFRLDPQRVAGIYPQQKEDRQILKLEEVPDDLVLALLSVEDKRFYQHWGIDFRSIARAFVANVMAGGTVQGGSTLTQQLIKNLFLSPERSLVRKINEALMAILIEIRYDKALILEAYLNEIYLGQSGSRQIHGFELASQFYFSQPLNRLSKDQIALLVGIVKGPSWYDPRRHPERARQRRNQVLSLMRDLDVLNDRQLADMSSRPLGITQKPNFSANQFPALVDLVKRQLKEDYDEDDLKSSGLRIFTSIDPLIQYKLEASVTKMLPMLERQKNPSTELQAAVIVASSQQGEVQAMVSDRSPSYPGFNRSLDAVRQIGSLIKPAIYLTALQKPDRYTLASLLEDSPLHISTANQETWSPQNYDKEFKGNIPLFHALRDSRNVPSVRLGLELGLEDIAGTLKNLGIKRKVPTYPSMTLGAFDLSPMDIANMYQTFAAGGFHVPLKVIREVLTNDDQPLKRYPLESTQTLDEKPVYLTNYVMHQVTQSGTARYLNKTMSHQLAGKTGTTDDLRDSWFAGFSDDQLAVVWLGRDDNTSTGLTGSSGALRLWADVMQTLPLMDLELTPPPGIEMRWIDGQSGALSDKSCQGAVELPFISGSAPTEKGKCKNGGLLYQLKQLFN